MELLADLIMELVPDAITEFFSEKCRGLIRERVAHPLPRKILYILAVPVLATVGVLLGFGLICLIGVPFQ